MLSKQKQRYLSRFSQHKLPSTLMKLSYLQFITQTSIISSCFPITHRKWIHVAFLPMLGIFARFASVRGLQRCQFDWRHTVQSHSLPHQGMSGGKAPARAEN